MLSIDSFLFVPVTARMLASIIGAGAVALALRFPCAIHAISLRFPCAIPALSLRYPCALSASLRFSCASPCAFPALSLRLPCAFPALSLRFPCAIPALAPRYPCAIPALSRAPWLSLRLEPVSGLCSFCAGRFLLVYRIFPAPIFLPISRGWVPSGVFEAIRRLWRRGLFFL